MIRLQHESKHLARVEAIANASKANARVLREAIPRVLYEGNRRERLAGNAKGGKLPPWKFRVGPYEGKTGATLAPNGDKSLSVAGFVSDVTSTGSTGFQVSAGFQGEAAEILGYHATGKSGKGRPFLKDGKLAGFRGVRGRVTGIVRDVFYIGRQMEKDLAAELRAHAEATFSGRVRTAAKYVRQTIYTRIKAPFRAWRQGGD